MDIDLPVFKKLTNYMICTRVRHKFCMFEKKLQSHTNLQEYTNSTKAVTCREVEPAFKELCPMQLKLPTPTTPHTNPTENTKAPSCPQHNMTKTHHPCH
jgi:hypothetical protein